MIEVNGPEIYGIGEHAGRACMRLSLSAPMDSGPETASRTVEKLQRAGGNLVSLVVLDTKEYPGWSSLEHAMIPMLADTWDVVVECDGTIPLPEMSSRIHVVMIPDQPLTELSRRKCDTLFLRWPDPCIPDLSPFDAWHLDVQPGGLLIGRPDTGDKRTDNKAEREGQAFVMANKRWRWSFA